MNTVTAKSLPLFVFLLLSIFSTQALALTYYTPNPYFTSSADNITATFFSPISNTTPSSNYNFSYYATCSNGNTGCVSFDNFGQSGTLYLVPESGDNATVLAEHELLVFLKYRVNQSMASPSYLTIAGENTTEILLNTTPNVWFTVSYTIDALHTDVNYTFMLTFYTDAVETNITLDRFAAYTVDAVDTNQLSGVQATDMTAYCGAGYASTIGVLTSADREDFYCRTTDGVNVTVVHFDNTTISRRVTWYSLEPYSNFPTVAQTRSFWHFYTCGYGSPDHCDISSSFILESLSLTSTKITQIINGTAGQGDSCRSVWFKFNGTINPFIILYNCSNNVGLLQDTKTTIRSSVSLLPYSNVESPAGTGWKYYNGPYNSTNYFGYSGSWLPFFSYNTITYNAGLYCVVGEDSEYQLLSNGTQINREYCGDCGCTCDGFGCSCNFDETNVGTTCMDYNESTTMRGYKTTESVCGDPTYTYGSCPVGSICVRYTAPDPPENQTGFAHIVTYSPFNTISCLNLSTSEEDLCVNENGTMVNCSAIAVAPHYDYCVNKDGSTILCSSITGIDGFALTLGLMLSSQIGHDVQTADTLLGLYISIIFAFLGLIIARKSRHAVNVFALCFLFGLFFSVAALGTVWLISMFIITVLITAGLFTGALKKLFGF